MAKPTRKNYPFEKWTEEERAQDRRKQIARENGKKGGRKPGFCREEAEKARILICGKLSEKFPEIVDTAIAQAIDGDDKARDWLTERAYGKVKQDIGIGEVGDFVSDEKRRNSQTVVARLLGLAVNIE